LHIVSVSANKITKSNFFITNHEKFALFSLAFLDNYIYGIFCRRHPLKKKHFIYIFQLFSRSNSFKCSGCKLMLSDQEFVRRVHGNVYHQTCFQCACCERPLQTGEKFYLRDDDKLVCAEDYHAWKTKGYCRAHYDICRTYPYVICLNRTLYFHSFNFPRCLSRML